MAQSNGFNLGQLLGPRSVIQADQLAADAGAGGVTTYTAIGDLPSSGLTSGDMAFVDSSDRLYIWTGAGWYNVALINQTPAIQSILDSDGLPSPFALSLEGATTTITMIAADPDGFPVSYIAVADSDFNAMATLSQVSNVFTITPTAIEGNTTGTITFKASDGINLASEISTFTLTFITIIENSKYTSLLVQSTGANNGTNSTFTDASANNLTLTAAGNTVATTFSPYRAGGYSTYFNGTNDYMTFPGQTTSQGKFTIEAWVNLSVLRNYQLIYDNRTSGATANGYAFGVNVAGQPYLYTSAGFQILSSISIGINTWNHIALVRNGTFSNALQLYVNGVLAGTQTNSNVFDDYTQNGIGVALTSIAGSEFFGYMSDLRIVNGVDVYTSNFTPPTEPLTAIAGTTLLTCQNNRFVDNSLNATTLTVVGAPTIAPYRPYDYKPYDPVVNGGSVYFDGAGDYLSIPSNATLTFGTGDFTIEGWHYFTGNTADIVYLFDCRDNNTMQIAPNILIESGQYKYYLNGGYAGSGGLRLANVWTHFAFVKTAGSTKLYINGSVVFTYADTRDYQSSTIRIGGEWTGTGYYWKGNISNLRVVKGTALYTAAFTPPTEPVTAISGTSLLINGTDASIIDASQTSALTLVDTAKSSTTQIKYGNSSIYFNGAGRLDLITPVPSFGTGDFTVEAWVYQMTENTYSSLCEIGNHLTVNGIIFITTSTGNAKIYSGAFYGSRPFPLGQWNHIAFVRSSGNLLIFVNGSAGSPVTFTNNLTDNSVVTVGGRSAEPSSGYLLNGYVQDFRVTKGLARYTTTFTPPAALLEG